MNPVSVALAARLVLTMTILVLASCSSGDLPSRKSADAPVAQLAFEWARSVMIWNDVDEDMERIYELSPGLEIDLADQPLRWALDGEELAWVENAEDGQPTQVVVHDLSDGVSLAFPGPWTGVGFTREGPLAIQGGERFAILPKDGTEPVVRHVQPPETMREVAGASFLGSMQDGFLIAVGNWTFQHPAPSDAYVIIRVGLDGVAREIGRVSVPTSATGGVWTTGPVQDPITGSVAFGLGGEDCRDDKVVEVIPEIETVREVVPPSVEGALSYLLPDSLSYEPEGHLLATFAVVEEACTGRDVDSHSYVLEDNGSWEELTLPNVTEADRTVVQVATGAHDLKAVLTVRSLDIGRFGEEYPENTVMDIFRPDEPVAIWGSIVGPQLLAWHRAPRELYGSTGVDGGR